MYRDIGQERNPTARQPSLSNTEGSTEIPQPHSNNLGITNDHDHHDSFSDVLATEPVLSGDNPGVRDNSEANNGTDKDDQDTTDNTSTTALFAGYGSDGLSTGRAAQHGRVVRRPESFILHRDSCIALTDFRSRGSPWAASACHTCQICKDGLLCWCPKRRLSRCTSYGKLYVIYGESHQWCCHNWIPGPSGSPSPTR